MSNLSKRVASRYLLSVATQQEKNNVIKFLLNIKNNPNATSNDFWRYRGQINDYINIINKYENKDIPKEIDDNPPDSIPLSELPTCVDEDDRYANWELKDFKEVLNRVGIMEPYNNISITDYWGPDSY